MEKKQKVLTTAKACEILNCSRTWFIKKHLPNLTILPKIDRRNLFDFKEVMKLKSKLEPKTKNHNYEIL